MASQEFLASFGVEIDEAGVFRLQRVLEEDRALADELAASFSAASEAIERFAEDLSLTLPSLYGGEGHGVTTETGFGTAGLRVGLDLTEAEEQLSSFLKLAQKPLFLSANASGMVSAARTALANIRNLFSEPLVIQAKVEQTGDPGGGGGGGDIVHFYRNVFTVVPNSKVKEVSKMLKAIHAQEDKAAALEKAKAVEAKFRKMKLSKAAQKIADSVAETLTYMGFPAGHWTRIRTNNVLERINREIKRRTKVVGTFPDGESALMLVCARLRHITSSVWGTKRYLNMEHLRSLEKEQEISGAI